MTRVQQMRQTVQRDPRPDGPGERAVCHLLASAAQNKKTNKKKPMRAPKRKP